MKVFAISDLHLSISNPKPMNIFGPVWENYLATIFEDWKQKVSNDDVVLLAGDFSWAMKLEDAVKDFELLSSLPGKKIIIKGNHDYWWNSIGKVRDVLPKGFFAIQNDAIKIEDVIFCGTRLWTFDDTKMLNRESIRLEMTLENAKKLQTNGQKIVCMVHYPPFEKKSMPTPFTQIIKKYDVSAVVYGHIHGVQSPNYPLINLIDDIPYYLTSCDITHNTLTQIL